MNETREQRPNILLVMTDQQHAGLMGNAGDAWVRTPAMDRLAREGTRFAQVCCTNPVCLPSRVSMATGLMPGRLGIAGNAYRDIPDDAVAQSMGNALRQARYATYYGGKTHLPGGLNPAAPPAGYDAFDPDAREGLPAPCLAFMREPRAKPFFAVASFINPHDICFAHAARCQSDRHRMPAVEDLYRQAVSLPVEALPPLPENFEIPAAEPEAIERGMSPKAITPAITMRREYTDRDWRIYRWIYRRLTEQVDASIGALLDGLDAAGLTETTLVVFLSDHGNMDAAHRLASKTVFYREAVEVPLILRYPPAIPAGVVNQTCLISTGLDLLPTLRDVAGLPAAPTLHGKSFRAQAEGRAADSTHAYVVAETHGGRMLRSLRYRYCCYDSGIVRESLVDLQDDPGELKNRAGDAAYGSILAEHRAQLRQWVATTGDREVSLCLGGDQQF